MEQDEDASAHNHDLASLEHREDSIELLFQTHFSRRYDTGVQVTADKAASALRLHEVWRSHRIDVDFDQFVEDAFLSLQYAYNQKYGQWDQVNDLRALYQDTWYKKIAPFASSLAPEATVLGVGVNDGREVRQLFENRNLHIDLLDISSEAIRQVAKQLSAYPNVRSFVGSFEDWKPESAEYDLFFSLRTLNSTSIDLQSCVRKSVALVKAGGILIYSVSNGYIHMGDRGEPRAVQGMFSYETGTIDAERPKQIAHEITQLLAAEDAAVIDVSEEPTEIFIVAQKNQSGGVSSDGGL
ncbi:methyltransferase domain-containing protein [Saccharothrix isguenensis]